LNPPIVILTIASIAEAEGYKAYGIYNICRRRRFKQVVRARLGLLDDNVESMRRIHTSASSNQSQQILCVRPMSRVHPEKLIGMWLKLYEIVVVDC